MPNKQPSFAERAQRMAKVADDLRDIAEAVKLEAIRMTAAAARFAERRGDKRERRAR